MIPYEVSIDVLRRNPPETWLDETVLSHAVKGSDMGATKHHVRGREIREAVARARIMKLDSVSSLMVNIESIRLRDLIRKQIEFAKSPFDYVLFEISMPDSMKEPIRWDLIALLITPRWVWFFKRKSNGAAISAFCVNPEGTRGAVDDPGVFGATYMNREEEQKVLEDYGEFLWMWRLTCLLLHAPKGVTIHDHPACNRVVKGKRRAYAAYSTVKIKLSQQETKRIIRTGVYGPKRAHEVRGTWVNYHRNPRCDHQWTRLDGEHERYLCQCGQLRVWRKTHGRGDASLGYVSHEYRVTA